MSPNTGDRNGDGTLTLNEFIEQLKEQHSQQPTALQTKLAQGGTEEDLNGHRRRIWRVVLDYFKVVPTVVHVSGATLH